jgi:multiple sugar transport system substrate-binding protein
MLGMEQMGEHFVQERKLNLDSPAFKRIWDTYYGPAVKGRVAIFNSFGDYLAITGDAVAITGSSAGAIFYPDSVTYKDGTKETAEFIVLPFPVFAGGEKVALQRGVDMCVIKSTPAKEYAASVFLKWLTSPEQNLPFTSSTGFIPVVKQAFDVMSEELQNIDNEMIKKARLTTITMQKEYRFYVQPVFDGFDVLQKKFIKEVQDRALAARKIESGTLTDDARFDFITAFNE